MVIFEGVSPKDNSVVFRLVSYNDPVLRLSRFLGSPESFQGLCLIILYFKRCM